MSNQRGFIMAVWMYVAAAAAAIALVGFLVAGWHSYTNGIDKKGYDRGVAEQTAMYAERDNAALLAAQARLKLEQDKATVAEAAANTAQRNAIAAYNKGNSDAKAKSNSVINDMRANLNRLCATGKVTGSADDSNSGLSATAGSGLGNNAGTDPGLPRPDAAVFLESESARADEVTRQLQAAQARILADIDTCNRK